MMILTKLDRFFLADVMKMGFPRKVQRFFLLLSLLSFVHPLELQARDNRLCFVGDTGMGTSSQTRVARSMKRDCDEIFIVGDVIYEEGIQSAKDPKLKPLFWRPYGNVKKIIIALGNHDHRGNVEAWVDLSKKHSNVIHPARFFAYRTGNVCVAVADTTPLKKSSGDPEQEKFFANLDFSMCEVKIAIGHHPYRSSGYHGRKVAAREWFFEKHILGKFDYYICGHDHHLEFAGEYEGTRAIISGSGGEVRKCPGSSPVLPGHCIESTGYFLLQGHRGKFQIVP